MTISQWSTTPLTNGSAVTGVNWAEGQLPSTVNDSARQMMADVAAWYGQASQNLNLTSIAGTNTITAAGPAQIASLAAGQIFTFIPAATNTGATTLDITPSGGSSLTAKNVFWNGAACVGGELRINVPCWVYYDGTRFQIVGSASMLQFKGASPTANRIPYAVGSSSLLQDSANLTFDGSTLTVAAAIVGSSAADITINTNKFTVAASSGNTVVAGTLGVTGTLTGAAANFSGALSATGVFNVASGGTGYDYAKVASTSSVDMRLEAYGTGSAGRVGTQSNHPVQVLANNTLAATFTGANTQLAGTLGVTGTTTAGSTFIGRASALSAARLSVEQSGATSEVAFITNSNTGFNSGTLFVVATATSTSLTGFQAIEYSSGYSGSTTVQFRVRGDGNVTNTNNSYGAISDAKLKNKIGLAASQWDDAKFLASALTRYTLKNDERDLVQLGWIAQEIEERCPGLVYESEDFEEVVEDGERARRRLGTVTKGIHYSVASLKFHKATGELLAWADDEVKPKLSDHDREINELKAWKAKAETALAANGITT